MSPVKRLLLITLIIPGYILVLRPLRIQINEQFLSKIPVSTPYRIEQRPTGLYILKDGWEDSEKKQLKVPFGMYYLLSILALVGASSGLKEYLQLITLHLGVWILSVLFFLLGSVGFNWSFSLMDLCTVYLIPVFTLGFVPLLYLKPRNSDTVAYERETGSAGGNTQKDPGNDRSSGGIIRGGDSSGK